MKEWFKKSARQIFCVFLAILIFVGLAFCVNFLVQDKVPVLLDIFEKIVTLGSKWILILPICLPLLFSVFALVFEKNKNTKFIFNALFFISIYQNILIFACLLTSEKLAVGDVFELPLALLVFLPLAFLFLILSPKLKGVKYKSKLGLNFKTTREDEFIWKQSHIEASYVFGGMSLILIVFCIIFAFVRCFVVLILGFIVSILIAILVVYLSSRKMYKKYMDMKNRRDEIERKKKETENSENSENLKTGNGSKSEKQTEEKEKDETEHLEKTYKKKGNKAKQKSSKE